MVAVGVGVEAGVGVSVALGVSVGVGCGEGVAAASGALLSSAIGRNVSCIASWAATLATRRTVRIDIDAMMVKRKMFDRGDI